MDQYFSHSMKKSSKDTPNQDKSIKNSGHGSHRHRTEGYASNTIT